MAETPVPSGSLEQRLKDAAREFRLNPPCRLMLEAADALTAQREALVRRIDREGWRHQEFNEFHTWADGVLAALSASPDGKQDG